MIHVFLSLVLDGNKDENNYESYVDCEYNNVKRVILFFAGSLAVGASQWGGLLQESCGDGWPASPA